RSRDNEPVTLLQLDAVVVRTLDRLAVQLDEGIGTLQAEFPEQSRDGRRGLQLELLAVAEHFHDVTSPVIGLDGRAVSDSSMRPAWNAARPASTARANARAIAAGSSASPIAVLTRTPSAPSSMLSAACDGEPSPASTITGTSACSTMISIACRSLSPRPEPMGAASGITVAHPAASSRFCSTGSGMTYGSTVKPSSTSRSAALNVSIPSGNR